MNTHESPRPGKIELESGALIATINPEGAYLESLSLTDGTELLFPRQEIDGKDRGGMPICAPIFGPGGQTGLNQHGFARNIPWQIESQQENGTELKVSLDEEMCSDQGIPKKYAGCDMKASFMLGSNYRGEHSLTTNLKITNNSQDILIATPGFHPYFPVQADRPADLVAVGGRNRTKTFNDISLKDSDKLSEPTAKVVFGIGSKNSEIPVSINSDTLMNYVVWSASPYKYICVEPTLAGPAVNERPLPELEELYGLQPAQSKVYTLEITWRRYHG